MAEEPRICTLHSLALRLIRNQGYRHGLEGALYAMSIAEEKDDKSKVFLNDLLTFYGNEEKLRTAARLRKTLKKIKGAWRDGEDPNSLGSAVSRVMPLCLKLMRKYGVVDWDEVIPIAHDIFLSLEEMPRWMKNIEYYLVDEYQDFNKAEQALVKSLISEAKSVVITGDDDQSLYSGRGGSPEGLRSLYKSNKYDKISLMRCHRCRKRILEAANAFLANMHSNPRTMLPKEGGGKVVCRALRTEQEEKEYLIKALNECIAQLPENPKPKERIVCLFPTRKILEYYMNAFVESSVACYTRKAIFDEGREKVKRVLELICEPEQRFVQRLLLEEFKEIKPRHKAAMLNLVLEENIGPVEAVEKLILSGGFERAALDSAQAFCDLCRALSSQDAGLIAAKLNEYLGMEENGLTEKIGDFIGELKGADRENAINDLCDTLVPETAMPNEDPRAVLCLTMHGAKGLTRKIVVMPGLEDSWLPGKAHDKDLDEKKRLFYVALTRATDGVLITYPEWRNWRSPLKYNSCGKVSRFIAQSGIGVVR